MATWIGCRFCWLNMLRTMIFHYLDHINRWHKKCHRIWLAQTINVSYYRLSVVNNRQSYSHGAQFSHIHLGSGIVHGVIVSNWMLSQDMKRFDSALFVMNILIEFFAHNGWAKWDHHEIFMNAFVLDKYWRHIFSIKSSKKVGKGLKLIEVPRRMSLELSGQEKISLTI